MRSVCRSKLDTATLAIAREVRQLRKLNPDAQEFTLAMGETSKNDKEIAILTLLVMFALAESVNSLTRAIQFHEGVFNLLLVLNARDKPLPSESKRCR